MASIDAVLERNAELYPRRLAVAGPRERVTWQELKARSVSIAGGLHAAALASGDRVCLWLPSSPSWVAAFLALRRLGLPGVSIGDRARPAELRDLLPKFRVAAVVTDAAFTPAITGVCDEAGVRIVEADGPCREETPQAHGHEALIHLTSGSSGTPKGVMRTEADLLEEARNVAEALQLTPDDCVLCATPVYHSFASGLLMACLWSATPCLLMDRLSPATLLDLARREEATMVAGVPYVFQTLTALTPSDAARPPLRLGVSGGAHLQAETARRFRERFGVPLVQEYGLSEAGIVTFNLTRPERVESVGAPIPNVRLCIVDPAEPARGLPAGATGEVLVRRAFPATAYLDHPDESLQTFTPLGIRTGDLGRLDADGCLTLTGRIKSMINVAGAKVAPREVEDALLAHSGVAEAVVFGVPSDELGEAVAAVVVANGACQPDEAGLIAHCRERLSSYKVPAVVHVVPDLPRTPSGKPDVASIRREFSPGGSRERSEVRL
jgi:rifamycin polyketide synthase module 1/2/3